MEEGIPVQVVSGPRTLIADDQSAALLAFLKTYDARCPACQYNLRGLTEPRCPECGRSMYLTVAPRRYPLLWLVVLLTAINLSAGCGILSGIVLLDELVRLKNVFVLHDSWAVAFLFLGTLASVVPAGVFTLGAALFVRLPRGIQALLAMGAVCWDLLLLLVLFIVISLHW